MKDTLLPVAHVFAMVMMVFAAIMLVPIAMAFWQFDPALWSFFSSGFGTLTSTRRMCAPSNDARGRPVS